MRSSRSAPPDSGWLTERPYAHRGLHGPGCIENSRAAFEAAIAAGFGIELDVQVTSDGEACVFHDRDLERLCGEVGLVSVRGLADLQRLKLLHAEETISSLPEVLGLIGGRVPVLIEIKAPGRRVAPLCRAVARALEPYDGRAAIMSFNPEVCRWFARHHPRWLRGLVISEMGKKNARGRLERGLSMRWARPHFLAYDIGDLPSRFASAQRARGLPVLTWTVRNPRDEEAASAFADQIIHELPSLR